MNSLTYLSRQFDVLASARTPPSTPTTEDTSPLSTFKHSEKDSNGCRVGRLQRTQTWSKPFTQPQARSSDESRSKRSFSLPAFDASTERKPSSQKAPTSSIERKNSKFHLRIRRIYLVRACVVMWNALYEAWKWVVRRGITRTSTHGIVIGMDPECDTEDVTSADEKDSEEELDPLVTRTLSQPTSDSVPHSSSITFPSSSPPPCSEQSPSVSSASSASPSYLASSIPAPEYLSLRLSSPTTRIKSSSLLPNPFATSLLTQSSTLSSQIARSPSPSASLPPTPPSYPRKTPFHLPKTLVLDLDETLIHSTSRPMLGHGTGGTGLLGLGGRRNKGAGHMVEVVLGGRSTLYHVYKRPFVDYFLRKVSDWYTLVIFTASMQEYADPVIDWLDAGRGILGRRLFRESCTQLPSGSYTKDLSIVEQDLSRVCLVDNSPISYNVNQANGIPIEGWTHDMSDEALLDLLPVLDSLRFTSDVRRVLGMRGF
ncbi:NIF-domain-containing protein [Ramaria rubella]|nr:NIF-domain-containing protein [Ramaria rubella]